MNIEVPNSIIAQLFAATKQHVLDGDRLIDTDDNAWDVEEEEHEDGDEQYENKVEI